MSKKIIKQDEKADFILTADWHIRDDQPEAWVDDYFTAQEETISFIGELQKKHQCPILCAGDLFHKARSSKELEVYCLSKLPDGIIAIPGNHDLPNHNINKVNDSSIGIMAASERIKLIVGPLDTLIPFGEVGGKRIGLIHSLLYHTDPIKVDGKIISKSAVKILKEHPEYDLILSGDNHQSFEVEYQGRLLINPGSMMKINAGQIDHKPRVYLYFTQENRVVTAFIPQNRANISRNHIDAAEAVLSRFDSFISRVNQDFELSLSFTENMKAYFKNNKTRKSVIETCWEHIN